MMIKALEQAARQSGGVSIPGVFKECGDVVRMHVV